MGESIMLLSRETGGTDVCAPDAGRHSVPTPWWWVAAAASLLLVPSGAVAQGGGGSIVGSVFDSTSAGPLVGADVVLWNTSHRTRTDGAGNFELEGLAPGEYSVIFYHPRLGHLGISSGSGSAVVAEGQEVAIELATPSMPTILANECVLERASTPGATQNSAMVYGVVTDARTAVPIPGAVVDMRWTDEAGRMQESRLRANPEGWFSTCGIPPGARAAGQARFLNLASARREVIVVERGEHEFDFALGDIGRTDVLGSVTDYASSEPLFGAEIRLAGTSQWAVSDGAGNFKMENVTPGEYTLVVTHVGYVGREQPIVVADDQGVQLGIQLATDPIELDPITVTVDRALVETEVALGGTMITPEDLERVRPRSRNAADLIELQRVPGLRIRRTQGSVCAQFMSGQVRLMKRNCESAMIYLDNVHVMEPAIALDLPPDMIDRVIVLRPVEATSLFGLGAAHGVIMIFTKSGTRRVP